MDQVTLNLGSLSDFKAQRKAQSNVTSTLRSTPTGGVDSHARVRQAHPAVRGLVADGLPRPLALPALQAQLVPETILDLQSDRLMTVDSRLESLTMRKTRLRPEKWRVSSKIRWPEAGFRAQNL